MLNCAKLAPVPVPTDGWLAVKIVEVLVDSNTRFSTNRPPTELYLG